MSEPKKIIQNPYDYAAQIRDGYHHFDFSKCLEWLETHGKLWYGQDFVISKVDHDLIHDLLIYAIGDKELCQKKGLSLQKGMLLTGPIGCGKTSLVNLIVSFFPDDQKYLVKSTRSIGLEFEKDGFNVINRYGKGVPNRIYCGGFRSICFDDLGLEQVRKYYGNECNVMAEILLTRYELFSAHKVLIHATTNLSASELESLYGNRVRSRMRAMFNLLAFPAGTVDKRK